MKFTHVRNKATNHIHKLIKYSFMHHEVKVHMYGKVLWRDASVLNIPLVPKRKITTNP